MPKLDAFNSLASNSTGVIRVARGTDGQPGTEMHVSGGAVRGSLRSPKAFAGSLVSKVAEFFRQIGEAFSRTYSQERAQRAHQAYDAFRDALGEAVGEKRAKKILAHVAEHSGWITPDEVKRSIQIANWIQAVDSTVPVQMDGRARAMQALLKTDPNAKPAVIAQHMFEMAASRRQGFDQTLVALEGTIRSALKDRSHQYLRKGMTPEQARSAALGEARRFFEGQLLKPGSASWAVFQSWTWGAEKLNGNFMRCVDIVEAMARVMKDELPEIYGEDPRLNNTDVVVPDEGEVNALGEQSEVIEGDDLPQDVPNEEPASLVSTEKRWLKKQSVLHQLHTYLTTRGGSNSAVADEAMSWVVESPFYKAPLGRGVLSLSGLPASTQKGLQDSHGVLTKDLVNWIVQSGQLTPQLDPQKDRIEVEVMERTGAGTLALMRVKVNGQNAFVIKECGNTFAQGDDSQPTYFGYHQGTDGHWVGQAFEDEKLDLVQGSALALHREIAVPGGGQFKLAMAAATFRYRPEVECTTVDKDGKIKDSARVEHQVNLLPAAQGKGLGEVLEGADQETARKAAADMGAALAAFHRTHLISEEPLNTGGLRTLVHGDFHPGNLFYDDQSRTITAIDLAGAAFNFIDRVETKAGEPAQFAQRDPAGHDMLVDVKRAVEQGTHFRHEAHGAALKQAFLQAYSDAFKDILGPDGQPRYTVESLSLLIKQENLGLALT